MQEAKILVAEDDPKLRSLLSSTLSDAFAVEETGSYSDLESLLEKPSLSYDVIVLDRMMHGFDASDLLPQFKEKFPQCKILILSAISTPTEKATSLDRGADYLSKPFANEELIARVRVLARRAPSEIRLGNIVIDVFSRSASIDGQTLPLTNKEYLLLWTLLRHPLKVFSKAALYELVWQTSADVESNSIETTVNKLRRKLEEAGASASIRNSRKLGYWIEE